MAERGRTGKVAHLPAAARAEINRRLYDGQKGRQICPAINREFGLSGDDAITEKNLSQWRSGGYQTYLDEMKERSTRVEAMRTVADFSAQMAKAGFGVSEGAVAVAGGKMMQLVETMDPEQAAKICGAIAALRNVEIDKERLGQKRRELEQRDRAQDQEDRKIRLQEERVQLATAEAVLRYAKSPEVQAILASRSNRAVQVSRIREVMYGNVGHGAKAKD